MGRPKALLEYRGETFLDRLIRIFIEAGVPPYVVLGHDAEAIVGGVKRAQEAVLVVNPRPERGQLSSLQTGLAALPVECSFALFTPVDAPAIAVSTVRRLVQAGDYAVVLPVHDGRHGHPVRIRRDVIAEILALDGTATARDVIHRHTGDTLHVEVDDTGILDDIDTPAALEALLP